MHHKTQAIILKKFPYGEADLIVTFFAKKEGRLVGIAKNARLSQRRFGGALELGSIVDLSYVTRVHSDLVRIEDAGVYYPTTGIMLSLNRISAMSKALELALAFLQERQSAPDKYDLLSEYIVNLSKKDADYLTRLSFELEWLTLSGYKPELEQCMGCGEGLKDEHLSFSMNQGGLLCSRCNRGSKVNIDKQAIDTIFMISKGEKSELSSIEAYPIQNLLSNYIEHILGRELTGSLIAKQL